MEHWTEYRIDEMEEMARNCTNINYIDTPDSYGELLNLQWCYGSNSKRFDEYINRIDKLDHICSSCGFEIQSPFGVPFYGQDGKAYCALCIINTYELF